MSHDDRIDACVKLGIWLRSESAVLDTAIEQAILQNSWFDRQSIRHALDQIAINYLDPEKLKRWTGQYKWIPGPAKKVGIIMAGNIPLVGFHDLLCVFISGHHSLIKMAQKDRTLLPALVEFMVQQDERLIPYFEWAEKLTGIDAILATGSNNSSRYFQYYFGKYPHIIRKNRVGVAVLNGDESEDQLFELGMDVFQYYGLGCRNVSSLFVPRGYDFTRLLRVWNRFNRVMDNNHYHNNFDYNLAIYTMGNVNYTVNEVIFLVEQDSLSSRIAAINYQFYDELPKLKLHLADIREQLQVIVSTMDLSPLAVTPPGKAQSPELGEYADGVDTLQFLTNL